MSLAVEGVSFRYGRKSADVLVDVSFEVDAGESVAIVGPSGSGKSTLLAIAGLLVAPKSGEVRVLGRSVRSRTDRARTRGRYVGWVFQTSNVIASRTVASNVAIPLVARSTPHNARAGTVESSLSAVGLAGYGERRAKNISGGELQRVCIARAVAMNPPIVVADEPTGNLDATTSAEVFTHLVSATATEGISLLVATHDMSVAQSCDRVFRLEAGSLLMDPPV